MVSIKMLILVVAQRFLRPFGYVVIGQKTLGTEVVDGWVTYHETGRHWHIQRLS